TLDFYGDHCRLLVAIEAAFPRKKPTHIINAEGSAAAVMLDMLGEEFDPRAADLIIILGRLPGLTAAVLEEQQRVPRHERRESYIYDGPPKRDLPPEYLRWSGRRF